MKINRDPLTEQLLGLVPDPADLVQYRAQVTEVLQENQKRIERERIATTAFWIFCAVSATAWLWFSAGSAQLPRGPFLACIFFVWGGVEVVKHSIRSSRLDVLKEIKQLQLQILDLGLKLAK